MAPLPLAPLGRNLVPLQILDGSAKGCAGSRLVAFVHYPQTRGSFLWEVVMIHYSLGGSEGERQEVFGGSAYRGILLAGVRICALLNE